MRGRFITFEGGEGSGKSTQARLLAARLATHGIDPVVTREPGGSTFAEAARRVLLDPATAPTSPLAAALLFNAARADHLAATIRPALATGRWVLCDRFSDSTRVYQGAAGGVDAGDLEQLERLVVGPDKPDLTILLDLDPAVGLARAGIRRETSGTSGGADAYEARQLEFHLKLREGFLAIAAAEPGRFVVVDAAQDPEPIAAAIWTAVGHRLGLS